MLAMLLWDDKKMPCIVLKGWNMFVCDSLNPEIAHHHLRKLSFVRRCESVLTTALCHMNV